MSKKQIGWLIIGCFLFLLTGLVVYITTLYNDVSETIETIYQPDIRQTSKLRTTEIELVEKDPFSLLLLGVDEREGDIGRSDTIIVLTVNLSLESIKMLSIPRDTQTEIIGLNKSDKINHAYAFGGIDMALHSVENLLNIPIDYVVQVNMESFEEIVNVVGGVTVENSFYFEEGDYTFDQGYIHLDGEEALRYVQMRMDDPQGDFGRQGRQKQVLQAVLNKGASFNMMKNYRKLLEIFEEHIKTNITFNQIIDIQKGYKNTLKQIDTISFEKGRGVFEDGIWYFQINNEELEDIKLQLKKHLEIE